MQRDQSKKLYEQSKKYFPGGVNSPVRAFGSVGGNPLFIEKGDGCRIWDVDGNEFIDFCCSWGPLILGHNHPKVRARVVETINNGTSFGAPSRQENQLGDLILSHHHYIDKIRFVNSGTEAVMSAVRLARGYTGKDKIIKFEGCYHGHVDSLLVKAGSGLVTFGTSSSAGVPKGSVNDTIVLKLNSIEAVKEAFSEFKDEIAGVILEPVPANNGLLLQDAEYLKQLRQVCSDHEALLIFDEVISGFRVGFEGAAAHYDIQPDIMTYGKIIGGGFPVGAYGASDEIMRSISPEGPVYQAGTLSGNPVAMAAGAAQLSECLQDGFYDELEKKTANFTQQISEFIDEKGLDAQIVHQDSIFWLTFSKEKIQSADQIDAGGMDRFKDFYNELLENGVYFGPSGYEVGFVSAAHSAEDLEQAAEVICRALEKVLK